MAKAKARRSVAVAVVVGVGLATIGAAQDPLPLTDALLVNTFTTSGQSQVEVAMSDNGTHVVVWRSDGQDGDAGAVRFRKFPGDGTAPFNEGTLNQQTAGEQRLPTIAMNGAGAWVAAWDSQGGAVEGIRMRPTNLNGVTLLAEVAASQATGVALASPESARADDGRFAIVWNESLDPFVRFFAADGVPLTGDVEVAPSVPDADREVVASLADGRWVVVAQADDALGNGLIAQFFGAGGAAEGDAIGLAGDPLENDHDPAVAETPDGGFVVAWEQTGNGIRLRRFDEAAAPLGAEVSISAEPQANQPRVVTSPDGPMVVVFNLLGGVGARELDRLGRPVGAVFEATPTGLFPEAGAGRDRFVVAWEGSGDGDGSAVFRRLYRFRSVFADGFESGATGGWSSAAP